MPSTETIITRLQVALEEQIAKHPVHSNFVDWDKFGEPATKEEAYLEADRLYSAARDAYNEKVDALKFSIQHYKEKRMLEMAHALIDLDGE